jgi:hypothetical protein
MYGTVCGNEFDLHAVWSCEFTSCAHGQCREVV